jgi:hypothetical protein
MNNLEWEACGKATAEASIILRERKIDWKSITIQLTKDSAFVRYHISEEIEDDNG